jgi:predicted Zn-dependent peptidase
VRRLIPVLAIALAVAPAGASDQTLDNGLRVVLIPHRANPMVASAVVVGAGVVDEPPEASGASHFLEHLLFDGTTTRTQRQLYDDVDRLGAYNNATTREDHTLFTMLVAKEHAEAGLAIQADMLFRSTIPAESFEKERKIVLEELARDRSDPSYDLEAAFRADAFAGTPIARPVLGTESSLAAITREQVLSYYKARYVPGNMTLVVMGDFEPSEMLAIVRRTFGSAPAGKMPKPLAGAWPAAPKANISIAAVEKGPARLLAAFPVAGDPYDRTTAAEELLLAAAADGKDSPLASALADRGVAIESPALSLERRRAPWSTVVLDAEVDPGVDPGKVLDAVADAIRSTRAGGDARPRLDLAITRAEADGAITRDQIHYFAMMRSSSIPGSPVGSIEAEVHAGSFAESDWDAASARLIAGVGSIRARLAGPGLAAGNRSWSAPPDPAPARTGAADVRSGALANGLRYVVRESGDSPVFALHLAFVPRGQGEPEGQEGITDVLHRLMLRATVVHDPAGLEERLAAVGARVKGVDDPAVPFDDYCTTPEFSWLRLEVPSSGWREAVALLAEMVRFPAIDEAGLKEAAHDATERAVRRDASPREVAGSALDALLAPGHPLLTPVYGTAASLGALTIADLQSYRAAAVVGSRMIVTVVGPAPAADVVRALTAAFGPLPAGAPIAPPLPAPIPMEAATAEMKVGKTQSSIAMGRLCDVPAEDRAPLAIAVAMLSDRLAFDLRETKGLAYSIGASTRPWAGRTRIDVTMGTRPENVETARAGIVDDLRAFAADTPTDAAVARAVNVARGAALMRRMTRISLAYEAGMEALRGRAPGDERRFVDSLRDVRPDDVKRVAGLYLDPARFSTAIAR